MAVMMAAGIAWGGTPAATASSNLLSNPGFEAGNLSGWTCSAANGVDYYGSFDSGGAEMGTDAVDAAQATLAYAKTLWPSMTYAHIGVTPMIGQNDDAAEVFTEADAHTLVSFAQANHLGRLAFWWVDRDQACGGSASGGGASGLPECSEISQSPLDFTKIFTAYTG